jgi:thiol-disulfide isomerase/thioredoxin
MKNFFLVLVFLLLAFDVNGQSSYKIGLDISIAEGSGFKKVYIAYEIAGTSYLDSLAINGKELRYEKTLYQPVVARLYTDSPAVEPTLLFLSQIKIPVFLRSSSFTLPQSRLQDDLMRLTENDRIRPTYFPLYGELTEKKDSIGLQKLAEVFETLRQEDIRRSFAYFESNPTSELVLYAFGRYAAFLSDYAILDKDFNRLPKWAQESPDGKAIAAKIEGAKTMQVHSFAKLFVQTSATGERIALEHYRGKYVLLDFWASWCGPCRKEHPHLKALYNQYKNQNFEIISVSLDDKKTEWLRAITKDGLLWPQVSDLKGQQNALALSYGVQAIPANFLINPEGIIVGKNLKGEALDTILAQYLSK